MSRLMISSDLHLGHKNIHKFRSEFSTADEHHETIFENLAMNIKKADSLLLLGDVAFSKYWLEKVSSINCKKITLVCGNHDTENRIKMIDLCNAYDEVQSLFSKRNIWFSHCPIHDTQFRGKIFNIHGHLHADKIDDSRYINACVEHHGFKPVSFYDLIESSI